MQCIFRQVDGIQPLHPSLPPLQKYLYPIYTVLSDPIPCRFGSDILPSKKVRSTISCSIPPDAAVHVDVAVSEAADGEHHAVRVERRAGDGACPRGREEGGVGLDGVDRCAGDVEEGEGVRVGAAVLIE